MSLVDLVMPKLGESIMEATILKWLKKPGDSVAQDESVLEIATDKVDSEVPSTTAGIIEEILYKENDVVPIGKVIARIKVGADSNGKSPSSQPPKREYEEANVVEEIPYVPTGNRQEAIGNRQQAIGNQQSATGNNPRFYSPLVLNIAASEGIPMTELEKIPGTGQDGRVSKKDIMNYVSSRKGRNQQQTESYKPQFFKVSSETFNTVFFTSLS